ncbi:LEAF RUST 10 DISEASE-RESISTANCE LOCUS RECEPTOR-LIKE PROTEIN KINASE-like 2.1 isoform X4 [Solanum stenotomum]|uniref:LEAF RUST 10 DISEASE-RESISTANCE LOCUS RECEPTOR-LIKE PROTEIN KINASE-like 2.1 isoform X4 n=1 Tax=Solanum stenotomum TaxID=172797 RepID=UPI0020D11FDF|nr:LEAF RUST 10 DISEASE-RESISTANCE LOCUS RECEPTOR-LIKE PROTEIN KINASE-like 2.1 isoform X4 [Solanum stenotomum]
MFQNQSICFFYYYFFVSLFFSFVRSSANNDTSSYAFCPKSTCNGVEISYPFWRLDNYNASAPQYCGYPGFGINCSKNQPLPIIYLPGDAFYVKSIDYKSYSLALVDADVFNETCPRAHHNLTLEKLPLKFSDSALELTFYFDCTEPLPDSLPAECLKSSGNRTYFYVGETEPDDLNWFGICEEKVVATVKERRRFQNNDWIGGFGAAMGEGFVLDWRSASECGQCEESDGRCGYNNSTQNLLCYCQDGTVKFKHCEGSKRDNAVKIAVGISAAGIGIVLICYMIYWFVFKKSSATRLSLPKQGREHQNVETFLRQYGSLAPKVYSYSDIRKMTNSLQVKLGQGGYGGVYKGYLNGRPVAVKILNSTKGNGEDFINEVASISRTSHVNIVTLLGFCFNGRERALIYEFMSNGSLDQHIYGEDSKLGWEKLYKIALGIGRGLEYLHRGCNARILHFDIKPHNILLDEDFCPKISDFGLAKLCLQKESMISMLEARGTIGYIAPEVFCRNFGGVSHKSDVYSYGMMVLEMVGGRRNYSAERSHHSEIYFPRWAYQRLVTDEDLNIQCITTKEDEEIAKKMILVGLWCIQTDPSQRPSMSKAIEMLEGNLETIQFPPKPFICSPSRSEGSSMIPLGKPTMPFIYSSSSSTLDSTEHLVI